MPKLAALRNRACVKQYIFGKLEKWFFWNYCG
jgi:hypothetical protein